LELPEERIALRVHEDAVVLVARPVQQLERIVHSPEARHHDGADGRLDVLAPGTRHELVMNRLHIGLPSKRTRAGAVRAARPWEWRGPRPAVTQGPDGLIAPAQMIEDQPQM